MLKLTQRRQHMALSKAGLARTAGVDQALVSKIESGRIRPYDRELSRLAEALGVPAHEAPSLLEIVEDATGTLYKKGRGELTRNYVKIALVHGLVEVPKVFMTLSYFGIAHVIEYEPVEDSFWLYATEENRERVLAAFPKGGRSVSAVRAQSRGEP